MVKNLLANAGDTRDTDSISGSGNSPGVGNGKLLQYSFLKNPIDRGAWPATVHGVFRESDTTESISMNADNNVSVQFSSVSQSCLTLCDPMDHSTAGLSVHHQLTEFTQTHVH